MELKHSGRMGTVLATWVHTFASCFVTSMKKDACVGQVSAQKRSDFIYISLSFCLAFVSNVQAAYSASVRTKNLERNLESGSL